MYNKKVPFPTDHTSLRRGTRALLREHDDVRLERLPAELVEDDRRHVPAPPRQQELLGVAAVRQRLAAVVDEPDAEAAPVDQRES